MKYVIFDLLMTGKKLYNDRVIKIDAMRINNGKFVNKFTQLVKTLLTIPSEIEKEENINTDKLLLKGMHAKNAHENFIDYIGDDILIGYNVYQQHIGMLINTYDRMNIKYPSNYVIDLLHLMRKYKIKLVKKQNIIDTIAKTIDDKYIEKLIKISDFNDEVSELSKYMLKGKEVRIKSKQGKIHTILPLDYLNKNNETYFRSYFVKLKKNKIISLCKFDKIYERK